MSFTKTLLGAALCVTISAPAIADIIVKDAYMRTSGPSAKTGAAFMQIINDSDANDQLIAASSDIADRLEMHTHIESGDGVMKMREVEGGFMIPANGMHELVRGGDHVMFLGMTKPVAQGDVISVTLTFEKAGDVVVEIPVDLKRKAKEGMKHGDMKHGAMKKKEGS